MIKRRIMAAVIGLSLASTGALGGILFEDDFSGALGDNWTTSGSGNFVVSGGPAGVLYITSGSIPEHNTVTTIDSFDIAGSIDLGDNPVVSVDLVNSNNYGAQYVELKLTFDADNYFLIRHRGGVGQARCAGAANGVPITVSTYPYSPAWVNEKMHFEFEVTATNVNVECWDLDTVTKVSDSYIHGWDLGALGSAQMAVSEVSLAHGQAYWTSYYDNAKITGVVPEPATMSLLVCGAVFCAVRRRR